MSTLHLSRAVTETIRTVPLEDWHEELADESLDPLNILLAAEFAEDDEDTTTIIEPKQEFYGYKQNPKYVGIVSDAASALATQIVSEINSTGVAIMSTTTLNNKAFDVKAFLKLAATINDTETTTTSRVKTPDWLVIKNGLGCTIANAFYVTAGIVKSTRGILDALTYTQRQYEDAVEKLTIQELRAGRTTVETFNFGPEMSKVGIILGSKGTAAEDVYDDDADEYGDEANHGSKTKLSGFNPDGMEYDLALVEAAQAVDKLEAVIANGERIIGDIIAWIDQHAVELNLEVETGHTVTLGPIGNEVRRARRERLTWETLLVGIQLQREFIRNNPRS